MCDKPLTFDLAQAEELAKVVQQDRRRLRRDAQLHRLSAGPAGPRDGPGRRTGRDQRRPRLLHPGLAAHAARRVRSRSRPPGAPIPASSGAAGCFGDIGTHAYNLGRFITGLLPSRFPAISRRSSTGRALDDYGTAVIRYTNGALGTVTASQISHGRENDIWIEVDGTKGALEWHQEEPNKMLVRRNGKPHQIYTRAGGPYLADRAGASTRLPSGHPEAFLEAFANIYTAAYDDMIVRAPAARSSTRRTASIPTSPTASMA